jgi:hypothetical protein
VNFRTSILLLVVLAMVAGYVFFVQVSESPDSQDVPPWFYSIDINDINRIVIHRHGEAAAFVLGEDNNWYFGEPEGLPVDIDRWGGVTLLLSGPQVRRVILEEPPIDLSPYGLDAPPIRIEVDLKDGETIPILLGDSTPDGVGIYAQMEGLPSIFTIVFGWGEVMARLVTEPPYPVWLYDLDTSAVIGIQLKTETETVNLIKESEGWRLGDEEQTPLNDSQVSALFDALQPPSSQAVVEFSAEDISRYGLNEPSLSLIFQTKELLAGNIPSLDEIRMNLGHLTDDGEGYYGQSFQAEGIPDVFQVNTAWVEALRAVADQISDTVADAQGNTN